jgi:hypothetical protein
MRAAFRASVFRSIAALASVPLVVSCNFVDVASSMAESQKHAGPIESEIEHAVVKRPRVTSAESGEILVTTVTFSEVPATSVGALEPIARAAIAREYKRQPFSLTISFQFQKQWPE